MGLVFVTGSGFSVFSGSGIVNFGFLITGVTLLLEGSCCIGCCILGFWFTGFWL